MVTEKELIEIMQALRQDPCEIAGSNAWSYRLVFELVRLREYLTKITKTDSLGMESKEKDWKLCVGLAKQGLDGPD